MDAFLRRWSASRAASWLVILVAIGAGASFQLMLGTSYVAASLDPLGHEGGVPVLLINLDRGTQGQRFVQALEDAPGPVAWTVRSSETDALSELAHKRAFGALVLPVDFSEVLASFASDSPRAPVVRVYSNPGASATGSLVAERAMELALEALRDRVREEALREAEVATLGIGALSLEQGRFLAEPVRSEAAVVNPVTPAGGAGLAPTYLVMACWIGGYIGAIALHRFQDIARLGGGRRVVAVGFAGATQAALATLALVWIGVRPADTVAVFLVLAAATWMAYALVGLLLDLFGIVGVLPAFAVFALGLPAAGGFYPVGLLPELYRALHPYNPLTWALEGLRTAMYAPGAGDAGTAGVNLALLALAAAGASLAWHRLKPTKAPAEAVADQPMR